MAEGRLQFNKRSFRGLSGNQLKMVAFFLMLCDHVGFMLIENGMLYGQNAMYWNMALGTSQGQKWYMIAKILRFIGRLSFPIFAFFVAEGFRYTQNAAKYITRMGVFALISEVPFDLACYGVPYYPEYQNVLFTYFIALLAMSLMQKARKHLLLKILIMAAFSGVAWLVKCDYGALGVALICLLYLLKNETKLRLWAGAVVSAVESTGFYGVSALSFLLLSLYRGNRGSASLKYFFYFMYPAHLAVFYALVYFANR